MGPRLQYVLFESSNRRLEAATGEVLKKVFLKI